MLHAFFRAVPIIGLCLVSVAAQERVPRVDQKSILTERLAGLGRVWGAVKFFHPFLAYKQIDWDGALVRAIPEVKAARTPDEYRAALNTMLRALDDPTTVAETAPVETSKPARISGGGTEASYFREVDGFIVVSATDWAKVRVSYDAGAYSKQAPMLTAIKSAKGIVIDCRYGDLSSSVLPPFYVRVYLDSLLPSLVKGTVALGTERYRLHSGYSPQMGSTSGGYTSALVTETPEVIDGQAEDQKPLAVLVDERAANLLPVLSGLQSNGAKVVHVGKSLDGWRLHEMRLPDGVRVTFPVADFVSPAGGSGFKPDIRLTAEAGAGDKAVSAAIAALKASSVDRAPITDTSLATPPHGWKDFPYPQMTFPREEYRLLALFRFWNVINYFYPYKHLADNPWGTVLTDFIPRFLENASALDYERTVAEMAARMQDSHGIVRGLRNLDAHLGGFAPPIRLASASGRLTVAELLDPIAAQGTGIELGDVIVAIDGEPVEQRLAALAKLRALSTPQSAYSFIFPTALRGAKDSTVTLDVQRTDRSTRHLKLTRTASLGTVAGMTPRRTPVYQILPTGYGYIDLARLPLADANKALAAVLATPAIIFDMRGYPNGTAWTLAPRLGEKKNPTAALFRRPLQIATSLHDDDLGGGAPDYAFEQKLPSAQGAAYKGKVVMLINEFAISQSEHTCLFFESATKVTFIGSKTNGANGDVTNLVLPGNIHVNFTGHDVRHADGRQLQRIGIQPDIKVEPTPKGLSDGRDEVLEAAISYLNGAQNKQ